jgi:hypothetical protein
MGLILLTMTFMVIASLVFAAFTVSTRALWTFPILVSLWTAFLWTLIGRGVATFSNPPHRPRRVFAIIIGCSLLALAALAVSILVGLLIAGPPTGSL